MSDMGEIFRDLKDHYRKQRAKNLIKSQSLLSDPRWTKHMDYHYSTIVKSHRLDYWPSKAKWQYKGKIKTGNIVKFIENIER